MTSEVWSPNRWQHAIHLVPPGTSIAALTSRGVGKSTGFASLMLRGAKEHGADYRALYVRKSYAGLRDFQDVLRDMFTRGYGRDGFSYNLTDMTLRTENGAYIELQELQDRRSYDKLQGRSFVECIIDESQQFPDFGLVNLLRSNLRSATLPTRTILGANPNGPSHIYLRERHLENRKPWEPYSLDGVQWVTAPGTFEVNDKIDTEQYRRDLIAATIGNSALRSAWIDNDWYSSDAGAFFAGSFDPARSVVDVTPENLPTPWLYDKYLAHDWGFAAPSATLVIFEAMDKLRLYPAPNPNEPLVDALKRPAPKGKIIPKGSVLVMDEFVSCPDLAAPTVGSRQTIPQLAEEIHAMCERWDCKPKGVADDAMAASMGDQERTFLEEFKRCEITFKPAKKGERIPSFARMQRLLASAGSTEAPGLYINSRCKYLLKTLPMVQRSEKHPEDCDDLNVGHAIDACRYALTPDTRSDTYCVVEPLYI